MRSPLRSALRRSVCGARSLRVAVVWLNDGFGSGIGRFLLRQNRHDVIHDIVRLVANLEELQVFWRNLSLLQHRTLQPLDQTFPVRRTDQRNGEMQDLSRLDQGESFEQLIGGPESSREDDESFRILDEHRLAHEEVAEVDPELYPSIQLLLEGKLDIAANGKAAAFRAPAVRGFHDPRPSSGDDGET